MEWLSEMPCSAGERRFQIVVRGGSLPAEVVSLLEANGIFVREVGDITMSDLGPNEILFDAPAPNMTFLDLPGITEWVEAGGAVFLMAHAGFSGSNESGKFNRINEYVSRLGFLFDGSHEGLPYRSPIEFVDNPILTGLLPENAPLGHGCRVLDAPGSASEVIARSGACHPVPLLHCDRTLLPYDTADPGDAVEVDHDCQGVLYEASEHPGDLPELHIIVPSWVAKGQITLRVERTIPAVLVLSTSDATHWKVIVGPGAEIEKVILNGNETQTADVPDGVEVETRSLRLGNGWPTGTGEDCHGSGDATEHLIALAEAATGLRMRSFHGCGNAPASFFTLK